MPSAAAIPSNLMTGPFKAGRDHEWDGTESLADFCYKNATLTAWQRRRTLDLLSQRRRIAHGPSLGRHVLQLAGQWPAAAEMKLVPHLACPASRCTMSFLEVGQQGACRSSARARDQPGSAGRSIVKRFNWYPGIDASFVEAELGHGRAWNKLFVDITPEDLASNGKPFPDRALQHRDPRSLRKVRKVILRAAFSSGGGGSTCWMVAHGVAVVRSEAPVSVTVISHPPHARFKVMKCRSCCTRSPLLVLPPALVIARRCSFFPLIIGGGRLQGGGRAFGLDVFAKTFDLYTRISSSLSVIVGRRC